MDKNSPDKRKQSDLQKQMSQHPTRNLTTQLQDNQNRSSIQSKQPLQQQVLQSGNKQQIIIVSPAGTGGGQTVNSNGGQAISLSGLSAHQLAQILQAYGVIGQEKQTNSKKEPTNIIVVNNNSSSGSQNTTQQISQTQLGQSLHQQIQQLQQQNQMMQQQILANASANMQGSARHMINSPLSQYIIDNDMLLQNLTHQLQQHQKQMIQQHQIFQINNLLKQFPQNQQQQQSQFQNSQHNTYSQPFGANSTNASSGIPRSQQNFDPNHVKIRVAQRNMSASNNPPAQKPSSKETSKIPAKFVHSAKKPRDMAPVLQNKELFDQQQLIRQKSQNKVANKERGQYSSATQRQKDFSSTKAPNSAGGPQGAQEKKKKRKQSKMFEEAEKVVKEVKQKQAIQQPQQQQLQLPPQPPPIPQISAKEKKRLRLEREKEREKELFEKNFQAKDLMISRMGLNVQRSFIVRPNAIIVYQQHRLVKLDITGNFFQPSAVPQSVVPAPLSPQKPLLITPEQLHDFYNHSQVKYFSNVSRALEVVEEPKEIFEKDQKTIDPKIHSIQERKIHEVLLKQLDQKFKSQKPESLARNPIVFPSNNIKDTTIFFNSRFESGNLREVEKLNEYEYNCYVNFDFNSTTHSQWYYFSVRNIGKGRQYKFNIMNLQKDESCYQIGMKPFVYSTKRNRQNGTNLWKRGCENVCYYKNKLRTKVRECAPDYEYDEDNIPCYEYEDEASQMVTLNTLSFCYEFEHENDITYFAYFQPYTLSDLEDYLFLINKKKEEENLHDIYKCEKLCDTVGGKPCYVLTITDNVKEDDISVEKCLEKEAEAAQKPPLKKDEEEVDPEIGENGAFLSGFQIMAKDGKDFDPSDHRKQTIFLTARVHPGESNASFMIEGAIDFLLQKNNKEAKMLRETFIFKIIPILNPDGVSYGNYRCNSVGADLNRRWPNPSKLLHPTIYYTKKLVKMCHQDNQVLLFCDFHGHTRKRNVFMYGCVSPQTEINQHKNNNLIRIVPYLLDQKNKLFSFADCKFANEKEKESTGRLVMFKEFGILNSYTIESTFYSHYHPRMGQRKKVNVEDENQIKVEELVEIGKDFCETVMAIINSKILKRKFIIDTATPLGTQTAGQGGNPLTQFLINQQNEQEKAKHVSNTQSYNQQNNVQSVIKGFINQPSLQPYSMLNMLENKTVSSLDNSMQSPKKKAKKVEAKSQQIPKDFLDNAVDDNSRNLKITQNDHDSTTKKKIKLIKQNTPKNMQKILLDPGQLTLNKTAQKEPNNPLDITLKSEEDITPVFTSQNYNDFSEIIEKRDSVEQQMNIIGEYTKGESKRSDMSLVLMTDNNEEDKIINSSYTEPQSSTKLGYDDYQIYQTAKKETGNFFKSGPSSNQKFKTPQVAASHKIQPNIPMIQQNQVQQIPGAVRTQKSKSSLSVTGNASLKPLNNQISNSIKYMNGAPVNNTQKIKQNPIKMDPQVQNYCNQQENNNLLEIQQRILQQRKQQAELQVATISKNIMNARQSYQSEKRKPPTSSSMGTQLPSINQGHTQEHRPVSQQKKENHRNITQFAYAEKEQMGQSKNNVNMKGNKNKSSYTVLGREQGQDYSFDRADGHASTKQSRQYNPIVNFDFKSNDTQMEGGQKQKGVNFQFNFQINMP